MSQTKAQLIEGLNVNTSAPADSLVINSSGNVGLGTSAPLARLDVSGDIYGTVGLHFGNASGGSFVKSGSIENLSNTSRSLRIGADPGNVGANSVIRFDVDGSEAARIDSSGRVGIGTTSPAELLEIIGTAPVFKAYGSSNSGAGSLYSSFNGGDFRVGIENSAGSLGYGGSAYARYLYSTGAHPLVISVNGGEAARIDSSGRLLVGTSTSLNADSLFQVYKSSGQIFGRIESGSLGNLDDCAWTAEAGGRFSSVGVIKNTANTNNAGYVFFSAEDGVGNYVWPDNSDVLRISTSFAHVGTTSGTVVGTQTSDERIKNIIGPVEYGLDTLKQIEPVRYSLKSEPKTEKLGFIAQQVQPLIPQSVFDTNEHIDGESEDAPTKLGMEYVALIPVLVNAIKELSAEVDALKAQLQAS